MPTSPAVSICILVLHRADLAACCLDALRRTGGCPPRTELVVVANGTPSEQLDGLQAFDDVLLVVNQHNLGFAAGCNQAASLASAPLLVFLNDDSTVEEGCIDALIRAASADRAIGAVGARILSGDGTLQEAGSVLWRDGSTSHVGEALPAGSGAYAASRDVDWASANGLLVTRRAWETVGGFDERYFPAYFEDVDLCLSLAAQGFRIRFEPQARLVHRTSQSTTGIYREFLWKRSRRKLVEKWGRALDRFEPRPPKDAGPVFDAAVERAVERLHACRTTGLAPVGSSVDGPWPPASADPVRAAADLHDEYVAFLEHRVAEADARIDTLQTYLSGLWGVQLRRWIGGRLLRPRR